jgi:16S rRNA (cytosine967-C5)-methyltransferase
MSNSVSGGAVTTKGVTGKTMPTAGSWAEAAGVIARWLDRRERIDELLQGLPARMPTAERARCQHLVFGVIRNFGRIDGELSRLVAHAPRFPTRAALLLAGFELLEAGPNPSEEGLVARIVHHAVERTKELASPAEARMVNAVVRKLAARLVAAPPPKVAPAAALAEYFSHPEWLVARWLRHFGAAPTRALLEWNQQPAPVHARWRGDGGPPEWLKATAWPEFYEIPSGRWADVEPLLKAGAIYLQDPGTRLAVELLGVQPGEAVLDACAAPGGKSLQLADHLHRAAGAGAAAGRIVALDVPGPRIERLKENLARARGVEVALVQCDLLRGASHELKDHSLPPLYPAVLLDVPCSNTGVMRHRVDVKWRLQEGDFRKHARQQLELLHAAARLVAPGGRLVYSTCSVDPEENEAVVREFFNSRAGGPFKLERSVVSLPWETGHDGAAAFRLRRNAE